MPILSNELGNGLLVVLIYLPKFTAMTIHSTSDPLFGHVYFYHTCKLNSPPNPRNGHFYELDFICFQLEEFLSKMDDPNYW